MPLIPTVAAVELAVCLLVIWPRVRRLVDTPFRVWHPCRTVKAAGLLVLYLLFLLASALLYPAVLHVVAPVAGGFLLFEWWRARFSHGRGLPPGSLGPVKLGWLRDPNFYKKQIAEYGPIFKINSGRRPTCCIFGHERGLKLLREHDDVLLGDPRKFSRFIPQGFIRYMHPALHKKYRKLFHAGISAETIDRSAPFIAATVRETLNRLADACRHSPARKVDPDEYIRDMLLTIFLQLFFGVQRNTPLSDDMRSLYAVIDLRNRACGSDRKGKRASEELIALLRRRAASYGDVRAERTARPQCFLRVVMEADPDAARDDTLLGNLAYMVVFGASDVTGLTRWILKMLVDHPVWIQRLREQGETLGYRAGEPIGMAERIVKETLRLEQSEFLKRRSTRDIWFDGYRIPKDWLIRICIKEGHRDPNVFARPNEFDPDRFRDREYSKIEYAPFGLYRHNCLGAHLTHTICRAFVIELARGFELRTGEEWSTEQGLFHWQPRHGHRIELQRRAAAAADQRPSDEAGLWASTPA